MIRSESRPRIKPEHGLRALSDRRVRLGGSVYGVAAEVIDETGAVWTMLNAADGTRTPNEIVDHVVAAHPGEEPSSVHAALDHFHQAGYLEDAAEADPPDLTVREKERYARSRQFYRWIDLSPRTTSWDLQLRLRSAQAAVVGLGGTGGTAALALAASGVGHVHCVDHDVVELSNLNRQILYDEDALGRPKVDVAVERIRRLNSDVLITGESMQVQSESDFERLAQDCDVLVLCADNPGTIRAWANTVCLATRTPWVDAGYHGPVVTAAAYVPGVGAYYECGWLTEYDKKRKDDPELQYTIERGGSSAVTATSAGLSGYLAAHLAMAVITGVPRIDPGHIQGINLMAADHHFLIPNDPHPHCPARCGAASEVRRLP